jgi:hypothetical protein
MERSSSTSTMMPNDPMPTELKRNPRFAHAPLLAAGAALLLALGGCAGDPMFDQTPARNANHPKATAVLERSAARSAADRNTADRNTADRNTADRTSADRSQERDSARPSARARERDDAAPKDTAALQEGIRLYNDGDYNGAIRRLSARDLDKGTLATRLAALKYTAFSYCLTSRPTQCRQSFDKALRLDPSFDLAPGEHGHPLWGPVFTKAKQTVAAR